MDLDDPNKNPQTMSESPRELQGNVNRQAESPGFRLPRINMFSRKPRLKPEVIELGPPTGTDEPSTSSHFNDVHSANTSHVNVGSPDMVAQEQENEGVFDTHIAVLYDRYLNMKEAVSNKIRDKIMAFMRDDLDNVPDDEELDVEGGLAPLRTESTYDRLVFIITILLGFVFRTPIMWIIGSLLFLIYGNFKRKIIKWGLINVFLAILSIVYGVQSWGFSDPETFMIKPGGRSILLSRKKHIKLEEGVLSYNGKDAVLLTIEGNKNLKWSIIHDDKEHKLKHGNFSNELLVDSKLIPPSTDMIRLNHEIMVKGLVQMAVKFKTKQQTPSQSFDVPKSHFYPLHHDPSINPYEVSFECHPVEPGAHRIESTRSKYHQIDFDEGTEDSGNNKNLKGMRRPKFYPYIKNKNEDQKVDGVEDESNSDNLPVEAFEKEEESLDESPIKADSKKENEGKKYIGVDAIESGVFVTRLFQVSTLSKCSLVHIPKSGTDVVSVYIKRLQ